MNIKSLASSSLGNCYLISDGKTNIMLDCGISIKRIKKGGDFKIHEFSACLLSHEHHGDHAKAVKDILKYGLDVYTSKGTAEALNLKHPSLHILTNKKSFKIGTFTVLPFDTQHDCNEPMGFLLYSDHSKEKLLFATDTYYIKYKFPGLTHIMVECNYDINILNHNVESGKLPEAMKNRVIRSHFSIDNLIKFLKANDLSEVIKIYLIHLSDGNSNEKDFKQRIENTFYKEVEVFPA